MKIIIAGSRYLDDYWAVDKAIKDSGFLELGVDEIVLGGCKGVDKAAEHWAHNNKIDVVIFPANWGKHGKAAGPIRNKKMSRYVYDTDDVVGLVAVWDGKSRGTKCMIDIMKRVTSNIHIYIPKKDSDK